MSDTVDLKYHGVINMVAPPGNSSDVEERKINR